MRYVLVLLLLLGTGLVLGGTFTTSVSAQAAVPPVLWGVDEDDNQLFSIQDYREIGAGAVAAGFTNHGRLRYNRGTAEAPNIVDLPLVTDNRGRISGAHIGSIALDSQGIAYMALNASLEFDDPTANLSAPVLLRFDTANATPAGTLDVVRVIGQINIPGFDEPDNSDNISGLSFDPVTGDLYALYRVGSGPAADRLLIVSPEDATMDPAFGLKGMSGMGQLVQDGEDLEFNTAGELYVTDDQDDHLYRIDKSTGAIVEVVDNNQSNGLPGGNPKIEGLAWDPELNQMVGAEDLRELFFIQTLENGNNTPLGSLTGLTDVEAIDFIIPAVGDPAIDIRKQAEGPDSRTFPSGSSDVTFIIVVANIGQVPLTNVTVTDDLTATCDRDIGALAVGAMVEYDCTVPTAVFAGFENVACVNGQANGTALEDCDPSTVVIPGIDIRKQAEGPDTRTILSGSLVTFDIVVTNTGEVTLTNVTVTDEATPECNNDAIPNLGVGESFNFQCTTTAQVTAGFENVACVSATLGDETVGDCDPSTVEIPNLDIRKQAEGPDSRTFPSGSDVTFTIVVTNTGEVDLVNVVVTDVLTPDCDNHIGNLASGASVNYNCTALQVHAGFENEACVAGRHRSETYTDCDPSTVEIPGLDIRKQAEGSDSRSVIGGSDVDFEIVVTNTGEVDLVNVAVTDVLTPTCDNTIGNLAAGASVTYTCTAPAVVAGFENVACVKGEANGTALEDCDPSTVEIPGSIDIEKWTKIVVPTSGGDVCDTLGKPGVFTLLYTGNNVVDHHQKEGSVKGKGGELNDESPVRITSKKGFDGELTIGESFDTEKGEVIIKDLDGNVLKEIEFHTSCSQPLVLGDNYGGVQLVGFTSKDGKSATFDPAPTTDFGVDADTPTGPEGRVGQDVTWTYFVTNTGAAPLKNIVVTDDNGTPGDTSDDFGPEFVRGDDNADGFLDMDETWLYQATGQVKLGQYANIGDVSGVGPDLTTVIDEDPSHHIGLLPAGDVCEGKRKLQTLTMRYTGDNVLNNSQSGKANVTGDPEFAAVVRIIAAEKAGDKAKNKYFDGTVNLGQTFVIDGTQTRLKSNTSVVILDQNDRVLQTINFHTSCSKPLERGDQFGGIQLIDVTSRAK